jgi:hypothetical protein
MSLPWQVPYKDLHVQVETQVVLSAKELFEDEELVEWFKVHLGLESLSQMLWFLSLAILKDDKKTLKAFAKQFAFDVEESDLAAYKPETLFELLKQYEDKTFGGET